MWVHIRRLPAELIARDELKRRVFSTIIWFAVSLLLAVVVPDIGIVIDLLGGLAAIFVFVFPGLYTAFLNEFVCYHL